MGPKQVILAHHSDAVSKLLKKFLSAKNVNVYILEQSEFSDFEYLLEDLSPDIFLAHKSICSLLKPSWNDLIEKYSKMSFILIGNRENEDCEFIEEPFDPSSIFDLLSHRP